MNTSGFQLHYRSAFDLKRKSGSVSAWKNVVALVQAWLMRKTRIQQFDFGPEFLKQGEWKAAQFPRTSVRVESALGVRTGNDPEFWAVSYEHPCGTFPSRQWQTQIGLTHSTDGVIGVAITTIHWLPDYVGDEPEPPLPTSPQIVSDLISNEDWEAFSGTESLSPRPKLLLVGHGDEFFSRLEDAKRGCPIVYASREHGSARFLMDLDHLAKNLAGMASVYSAETDEIDEELEHFLIEDFRCANGMVRVYQPQARFDSPNDYRRHRFFSRAYILERGTSHTESVITKGIARRSLTTLPNVVMTLDDISSRARETRLHQLRADVESAAGQREMIELFTAELAKSESKVQSLEAENRMLAALREDLDNKVDRLEYENSMFQRRAASVEDNDAKLQAQVDTVRNLAALPESLRDVIDLISGVYSDRIYFTDRAKKSANGYVIDLDVAWECLRSMATVLHDLYFNQKLTAREIAQQFKAKTSYDLGLFDSETTKNNKRFSALRRDSFEGKSIDISAHVKHRNSKPNLLRVHFCANQDKKLLIIGHCADHLDTINTN